MASEQCINTAVSGPAAGVVGSVNIATLAGSENVITIDMGGTSFDICLAYKGEFSLTKQTEIGGHAIKVPMIDIHTIGAGGGSIGWIDPGGALRVGPQSAGAVPGPACYNKGGTDPTVTDANLVLGRIDPLYYLGGEMTVDRELSAKVIREKIAAPLGLSLEKAAEGMIRVINAGMSKGIRYVSVEKGYDPREFAMVSFGGGGSLHALEIAEDLGIAKVIVPLIPGVTSAWGLLMADFRHEFTHTYYKREKNIDFADLNGKFAEMTKSAIR
jgi:N-methylhydantoinase A